MTFVSRFISPVLLAQISNVVAAIATYAIVARALPVADFARYAAFSGLFAVGNAAIGFAFGVQLMASVASDDVRARVSWRSLVAGGSALAALTIGGGLAAGADLSTCVVAVVGQWTWCAAEVAAGHALGTLNFRKYASLTFGRLTLWVAGVVLAINMLSPADRLRGILAALAISGVVPVIYLARNAVVSRDSPPQIISGRSLTLYQVGMWIIGSADRVIFAHINPVGGASYAAMYGVLDRAFRTVSTSELLQRLPRLLAGSPTRRRRLPALASIPVVFVMVVTSAAAGPSIVGYLTGEKYMPGYVLSSLLSVSLGLMLLSTPRVADLVAGGGEASLAYGACGVAGFNVVANLVMIPMFGAAGAAGVNLGSYGLWYAYLALMCRDRRPLDLTRSTHAGNDIAGPLLHNSAMVSE
jgi:O-antigen/teichoic acid export membrane protein